MNPQDNPENEVSVQQWPTPTKNTIGAVHNCDAIEDGLISYTSFIGPGRMRLIDNPLIAAQDSFEQKLDTLQEQS
ncbi:hypothetical protein M5689_011508 [Euphorbia peplus]|nr:hypothetical protein M5689_011508 [Euphorbia peplus]